MSLDQDLSGDLSGPSHGEHGDAAHAAQAASASTPHGPPFVCAACKQTYSRLEYLRRHERRHADIRPFVCECGKGFSRSDVLGRHKKQCKAVVGENGSNKDADSPNDRDQGGPPAKKQRRSVGGARKKKSPEQPSSLDPSLPTLTGYSTADQSPESAGHDSLPNIDPALTGMSQSHMMSADLAASTSNANLIQVSSDYATRGGYTHDASMAFPYSQAPAAGGGPSTSLTTSADVASVASVALAELAAAATMLPSSISSILESSNALMAQNNSQAVVDSRSGSTSASSTEARGSGEDDETSPGAERALLRITGGGQEVRAGLNLLHDQSWPDYTGVGALVPSGGNAAVGSVGNLQVGSGVGVPAVASASNFSKQNSMEWILSPSLQQLIAWANASSTDPSPLSSDRSSSFSYFQSMASLSSSTSNSSLGMPSFNYDLSALTGMAPDATPGDIQATLGANMSNAAIAAASAAQPLSIEGGGVEGMFGGAGAGGLVEGAASAIASGLVSESEPGLATALATMKRARAAAQGQQAWKAGQTLDLQKAFTDARNPFFIPQHLFRACYSIPHWDLPPLTRLSMLAFYSQKNLLKHFPFMHEPTFRIDTTPGCLAFATCMLGSSESGRKWWAGEDVLPRPPTAHIVEDGNSEGQYFDEEDGEVLVRPIVMDEKMDMLLRVFGVRCKSQLDRVAAVQCLSLSQWKELLAADPKRRARAALTQQKITAYARKSGFFNDKAEWLEPRANYTASQVLDAMLSEAAELCFSYSYLPTYLPSCPDEEKVWRRWCDWEGRRRTAYMLFLVDTVAHLDTGASMVMCVDDVAHIPLPSPDFVWRTMTPERWMEALERYEGPTLAEALHQLLGPGSEEIPRPTRGVSIVGSHGPFARLMMMLSLLRGILFLMEGRQSQVARPSTLAKYFGAPLAPDGGRSEVRIFKHALARWRSAWNSDPMCKNVGWVQRWDDPSVLDTGEGMHIDMDDGTDSSSRAHGNSALPIFTSRTSHGATPLCDDALPFCWLGHVLLDHVSRGKKLPQRPVGSTVAAGKENISNKTKAKLGQSPTPADLTATVPDFRVLLKLAKQYVSGGAQGNPVDWPNIPLELFSTST